MRSNVRRRVMLLTLPVMLLASSATAFDSVGAETAGTQTITAGQLKVFDSVCPLSYSEEFIAPLFSDVTLAPRSS